MFRGLAAFPNVEVRLFNPFCCARQSVASRFAASLGEFRRLNHRMHNKLFIADGAMAVMGGRNIADEYFARSATSNFVDMDVLVVGEVVGRIERTPQSDVRAVRLVQQPFLPGAPERGAVGEALPEVGIPGVEVGIEMHQCQRSVALGGGPQERQRDGVVPTDGDQPPAARQERVGRGLYLGDRRLNIEWRAREVAGVDDDDCVAVQ